MDSVWIVTSGQYSEYGINAVFATEEDAKVWIGPYTDDYDIEEWHFGGERITPVGTSAYYVKMHQDGTVETISMSERNERYAQKNDTQVFTNDRYKSQWMGTAMITYMFARDEQHAIKIANERRAYLIATEQWNDGTYSNAVATLQEESPPGDAAGADNAE